MKLHLPTGRHPLVTDPARLSRWLSGVAAELGLPHVGYTDAAPLPEDGARFAAWLAEDRAGCMGYLREGAGPEDSPRAHPASLLPEARSIVVAALPYPSPSEDDSSTQDARLRGVVAAYARGNDYHHVLKDRLLLLADALADAIGRPVLARACVDTAPLLERALAVRAGLGFVAKNTLVITPGRGSYFVLGELLVDVSIPSALELPDLDGCGRCRACLDACPTGAFDGPFQLDARRCVSYLTIEVSGALPRELRAGIGNRVFGCDECQSVCPYNRTAHRKPSEPEFAPRPELALPDLEALLFLGSARYRTLVRGSALKRTHRAQLCRNAAIALGNTGDARAIDPLRRAVEEHPLELARSHAAWALGRLAVDFGHERARQALDAQVDHPDAEVRDERRRWLGPGPAPG